MNRSVQKLDKECPCLCENCGGYATCRLGIRLNGKSYSIPLCEKHFAEEMIKMDKLLSE